MKGTVAHLVGEDVPGAKSLNTPWPSTWCLHALVVQLVAKENGEVSALDGQGLDAIADGLFRRQIGWPELERRDDRQVLPRCNRQFPLNL